MDPISLFAWIVVVASVVKIVTLSINPKAWIKFTTKLLENVHALSIVSFLLAGIVLYYLVQTINIIHVFAVILFVYLISIATISVYAHEYIGIVKKIVNEKHFFRRALFPILIWAVLVIWAVKELAF